MNAWKQFGRGMLGVSPLILGVIPFGLVCGASSVEAGMSEWGPVMMSVVIFAGASQLVVTQLFANDAPWLVILMTGVVINLRMLMYSASLSGHLGKESWLKKFGIAYLLTDQAFATSLRAYEEAEGNACNKVVYYFGAALFAWTSFLVSTTVGAYAGATIPADWDLGFSVPLTFLALLMSSMRNRFFAVAAGVAGVCTLGLQGLPYNLGLLLGAMAGLAGGYLFEKRSKHAN